MIVLFVLIEKHVCSWVIKHLQEINSNLTSIYFHEET